MRPAFTLVELLIAIAVFTIGVLALAATAGLVASRVTDGGRLTNAAHTARSVLDSLRVRPCSVLASGSDVRRGVRVQWTVARDSLAARVTVRVDSDLRRRVRMDEYQSLVPCVRE